MHIYLLQDINDLIIQIRFKTPNGRNKGLEEQLER